MSYYPDLRKIAASMGPQPIAARVPQRRSRKTELGREERNEKVRAALMAMGKATAVQIAERAGVSYSTVFRSVKELCERCGTVQEGKPWNSCVLYRLKTA